MSKTKETGPKFAAKGKTSSYRSRYNKKRNENQKKKKNQIVNYQEVKLRIMNLYQ